MLVRAEAFFRKLQRAFSRDQWMARLLNLPKIEGQATKPGLVIIQIDGLGFTEFERAMKNGRMPFLARLSKQQGYVSRRHYTGLPSNTPAVQGMLFYGVKACVPAFSFKDSQSGQVFNMFNPESAAAVEKRLKEKGKNLLEGGSSYGNIFTGGAQEAHFCVASMGWGGLVKAANPFGIPVTLLLNLHIFVRALFLVIVEFFLAVFDCIRGIISGENFIIEIGFIPLRVTVCALLREVIAAGAKIDMARGLPVIHINFAGYDEQAHHRGPSSTFARWCLKGIDSAIARVWNAAQRSQQRDYDIFIYSDHGQEEAIPYHQEYGRSIQEAVTEVFREQALSKHWQMQFIHSVPHWRAKLLRNKVAKKLDTILVPSEIKEEEAGVQVVVAAMGPVGYIYSPQSFSMEEKDKIAQGLVLSAKIPLVMISGEPGKAFAWTHEGKFVLPDEADKIIGTEHPFFKEVAAELGDLCRHPDAGDFVIFGWKKGCKSLSFPAQQGHGSHAGPGPEETSGFALLPVDALPRAFGKTVCTQDLREAAFRALGRGDDKAFFERDPNEPPSSVLRLMTYNVHHCMGRDGKISPGRIARIIARHDPDIVALQELNTNDAVDQAEIIAQKLAMVYQFHSSYSVKKGRQGNAIFSKFPIRPIRNSSLPRLLRTPLLEPRGALWVEIDVYGQKVQVLNTHLSLSSYEGLMQMKALCGPDWMENPAFQGPAIFCGDLNALSGSKICKTIGQKLKNTQFELKGHRLLKTLPSFFPLGLVDHIFVGPGIRTVKVEVPKTALEKVSSDHLPVIVEVELIAHTQDAVREGSVGVK